MKPGAECVPGLQSEVSTVPNVGHRKGAFSGRHVLGGPTLELVPGVVLVGDVEHGAAVDEALAVGSVEGNVVEEHVGVGATVGVGLEHAHERQREVVVPNAEDLGFNLEAELGGAP